MQNLLPVILTEVLMTILLSFVIIYLYDRKSDTTFRQRAVVALVLTMMGSMLNSLAYYVVSDRSFLSTVIAVNISMVVMSGTLITLLWQHSTDRGERAMTSRSVLTFSALLIFNEVSMGIFVYILGFGFHADVKTYSLPSISIQLLSLGVNTYLFIAPMVAEMCVVLVLRPIRGIHRIALVVLILISVFSPTVLGNEAFTQIGSFLVIILMILFIPVLLYYIFSDSNNSNSFSLLWIFPIFLFMMAGVAFGIFYTGAFAYGWAIYGTGMLLGMGFYFAYSFNYGLNGSENRKHASADTI